MIEPIAAISRHGIESLIVYMVERGGRKANRQTIARSEDLNTIREMNNHRVNIGAGAQSGDDLGRFAVTGFAQASQADSKMTRLSVTLLLLAANDGSAVRQSS